MGSSPDSSRRRHRRHSRQRREPSDRPVSPADSRRATSSCTEISIRRSYEARDYDDCDIPRMSATSSSSRKLDNVTIVIHNDKEKRSKVFDAKLITTSTILKRGLSPHNNPFFPEIRITPTMQTNGRQPILNELSRQDWIDLICYWRFGQQLEDEVFQDSIIGILINRLRGPTRSREGATFIQALRSGTLINNIWGGEDSEPFRKFVVDAIARFRTEDDAIEFGDSTKYPAEFIAELYVAEVEAKTYSSERDLSGWTWHGPKLIGGIPPPPPPPFVDVNVVFEQGRLRSSMRSLGGTPRSSYRVGFEDPLVELCKYHVHSQHGRPCWRTPIWD
ncbi:hypothetical protein P280DRAFT_466538 [Massarina eburnea CBS 473.64]|uniref:Uncharacterized protein n=1 Tax=Massarina eburnea CBS 473.64 TaxID=1395130 RepID=A0A6A6S891_9PLEO|nr:hypothetical protein P280DRAFT_466538 [Massarina eburnea CBS 473.64]